jgi:hypothetical protein
MGLCSFYATHSKRLPIHFFTGGCIVLTLIAPYLPQAASQLPLCAPQLPLCAPPIVTGVALDGIGWWVVYLFYILCKFWRISLVGEFLLLPLECGKCNTRCTPITPRAIPAITGSRREEQIDQ